MKRRLAGLLTFFTASCGAGDRSPQDLTDSADPAYQVDLERCPRTPEWANLELPGGGLADVTIVQLGPTKLYIPMPWLREAGWRAASRPPSQGIVARVGGARPSEPPLDQHFRNHREAAQPNCPGVVHVITPRSPGTSATEPDFRLELNFERSAMGPPHNDYNGQLLRLYGHHSVVLEFSHDRRAAGVDLVKETAQPLPPQRERRFAGTYVFGVNTSGWTETGQSRASSFSIVHPAGDRFNPAFAGVNTLGVIKFPFWATETIMLTYQVPEQNVGPEHWSSFRAPLRDLLAWLSTPPRLRDEQREFSLKPG